VPISPLGGLPPGRPEGGFPSAKTVVADIVTIKAIRKAKIFFIKVSSFNPFSGLRHSVARLTAMILPAKG
jgi:hypothetical protein